MSIFYGWYDSFVIQIRLHKSFRAQILRWKIKCIKYVTMLINYLNFENLLKAYQVDRLTRFTIPFTIKNRQLDDIGDFNDLIGVLFISLPFVSVSIDLLRWQSPHSYTLFFSIPSILFALLCVGLCLFLSCISFLLLFTFFAFFPVFSNSHSLQSEIIDTHQHAPITFANPFGYTWIDSAIPWSLFGSNRFHQLASDYAQQRQTC